MFRVGGLWFCLLLFSFAIQSQTLTKIPLEVAEQGDFYLFDITDGDTRVTSAIDAYQLNQVTYIAVSPLLDGLKVNYRFNQNELIISFNEEETIIPLLEIGNSNPSLGWFNDGVYNFVPIDVLAGVFATETDINTSLLTLGFSGHENEFPYKKLRNNQLLRQSNQFFTGTGYQSDGSRKSRSVITVPDEYRLFTAPVGYAQIDYSGNESNSDVTAVVQTTSDLAYHSTLLTLTKTEDDLLSQMRLTRYKSSPDEKLLGFLDTYSFGDIWSRSASISNDESRGLGFSMSTNFINGYHENFATSFTKVGKPGWEADVFHNGRFLETIVVPDDGLMVFEDLEVYFGNNEFKILMYGPFGEQEELIERVEVRKTSLASGDTSFNLSILEYDSSLLDIDLDEFDIDGVSGNFKWGVLDNWMTGVNFSFSDIHEDDGPNRTYSVINQISLPDWFIDNSLRYSDDSWSQTTNLATSFFSNDSFVLNYRSSWDSDSSLTSPGESEVGISYNLTGDSFTNNFLYSYEDGVDSRSERIQHRVTYYAPYLNVSNTLAYTVEDEVEEVLGSIGVTTRFFSDFRVNLQIPYDAKGDKFIESDNITASVNYYKRTESANHNVQLSSRSLLEDNIWTLSYNLSLRQPMYQVTMGASYDSEDNWRLRAGMVFNFGYDYYNNSFTFTRENIHKGGTVDVYAYLDRRLNGVPDILDYGLEGVSFYGAKGWENVQTNETGVARLFGATTGKTALSAEWNLGSRSINQDYLIYSHPGAQHRVNLPFYLTTELESFVVTITGDTYKELANVPITAFNTSTQDVYIIESDVDGYINFIDLLPGSYEVYVDNEWLEDKGYTTKYNGFTFDAPLTGGFVVLPNIELSRALSSESSAPSLLAIKLDETNSEPAIETDNDKLIHLPPKGRFKSPHSFDHLSNAEFRSVRQSVTKELRKSLREELDSAQKSAQYGALGVAETRTLSQPLDENSRGYLLSIGDFETVQEARNFAEIMGQNLKIHQGLNNSGNPIYLVQYKTFDSESDALAYADMFYPSRFYQVKEIERDTSGRQKVELIPTEVVEDTAQQISGWVVQLAASTTLDRAIVLSQEFNEIDNLHIATKDISGTTWYCVVSDSYEDRALASELVDTFGNESFIATASSYLNIVWSK